MRKMLSYWRIVMIFTTMICIIQTQGVSARLTCELIPNSLPKEPIVLKIEKGTKINLAGYIYWEEAGLLLNDISDDSYSVRNKNICSINKKGRLTAKNTGTTTVTVRYKRQKIKLKVKVVKKKISDNEKVKKVNAAVKKFYKGVTSADSINKDNRIKKLKQYKYANECIEELVGRGGYEKYYRGVYKDVCVTPDYYKLWKAWEKFDDYCDLVYDSSFHDHSLTVPFEAERVEASEDKIVIRLKEAISDDVVFYNLFKNVMTSCSSYYNDSSFQPEEEKHPSQFFTISSVDINEETPAQYVIGPIVRADGKDTGEYYLIGTLKQGEKEIPFVPYIRDYENGGYKPARLDRTKWRFGKITDRTDECPDWLWGFSEFEVK